MNKPKGGPEPYDDTPWVGRRPTLEKDLADATLVTGDCHCFDNRRFPVPPRFVVRNSVGH